MVLDLPPNKVGTRVSVRCTNLIKTYGTGRTAVRALRGINLEVRSGELMMLVGPSGCGKTTLISVIAGVLSRDGAATTHAIDDKRHGHVFCGGKCWN